MSTRTTSFRRLAAGVGALALATVGLLGSAAHADVPDLSPGNIDAGASGSLTVHKFGGDPVGADNGGTEIDDTSGFGTPLDGVEFTVYQVAHNGDEIDLTDPAAWDLIAELEAADVEAAPWSLEQVGQGETVSGVVDFDLPLGLYLVKETAPGDNQIVSPVAPFLVTVPFPSDGEWLYDVHVYPKNKLNTTQPEKDVADPGHAIVLGDEVTWTITAPVPAIAADDTYRSFTITDQLDPRLAPTGITVTNSGAELLAEDYTVTPALPGDAGAEVVVSLTDSGLGKIVADDVITVVLTTEVTALGDSAEFANDALVNTNGSEASTDPVAVYYGALQVKKFEDGHEDNTLAGAEFALYAADGENDPTGDVIARGTTGADGTLTFDGLWVGTSDDATRTYVLVETKAPAGYVLPTGDAAEFPVTIAVGDDNQVEVTVQDVPNAKHEGLDLPLTGAAGTMIFTVLGVALIATGGTFALIRHSRSKA